MRRVVAVLVIMVSAAVAHALTGDHLKCYRLKDTLKLSAVVDLNAQFGLEAGCKVSPAKLFCVPATKTVTSATDKHTGNPITPLPFSAAPTPNDRICYKVKCPKPTTPIPSQTATDQFGTRTLAKFTASMLCTPAVTGAGFCGNGALDAGEDCDGANLNGATCQTQGFASGTLGCAPGCRFDTGACVPSTVTGCGNGVREGAEQCDGGDLGSATCASLGYTLGGTLGCTAGCGFDSSGCTGAAGCLGQAFPATGQMTCWDGSGTAIPCAGTGQDGEIRAGATLAYIDNGDGTITDVNTGLMWEKKSWDGSIHDVDRTWVWLDSFARLVAGLNTGVPGLDAGNFAGHNDWRIPNVKELQSIVNYENLPAESPVFSNNCAPGCTVLTCSCTSPPSIPDAYWTSTTYKGYPNSAWYISSGDGIMIATTKSAYLRARAVRGGS